jgi:hypothetical protein
MLYRFATGICQCHIRFRPTSTGNGNSVDEMLTATSLVLAQGDRFAVHFACQIGFFKPVLTEPEACVPPSTS